MTRGRKSDVGDTRVAPNGYHYTKTDRGWEATHRIIAARKLGRRLSEREWVQFRDGDRTNLTEENLEVFEIGQKSKEKRIAELEAKIQDLQHQLQELVDSE